MEDRCEGLSVRAGHCFIAGGGRSDATGEWIHGTFPVGVDAVAQKDAEHLLRSIDRESRTRPPGRHFPDGTGCSQFRSGFWPLIAI